MELQFQKREIPCIRNLLTQVKNLEQTQELRIPEGQPAAARVLSAWGQILMRGKDWNRDNVQLSGGVLVWVLYESEEDGRIRQLESWIPFRMEWDLPEEGQNGQVRFQPLLRFADARLISAGKLLLRVGIAVQAECWGSCREETSLPGEIPEPVELLHQAWPVRLPREAGEKPFELEDTLTLPASAPPVDRIVYCRLVPVVTDQKVLGSKLVFRGSGGLHVLYLCEDGSLHHWDFDLPFSQYAELEEVYSADAQADVQVAVTRLELEPDGEGNLLLKTGLTGQYLVDDRQTLELVEDAYEPHREVTLQQEELRIPVMLDTHQERISGEQDLPIQADTVVDVSFLPDFPRMSRENDRVALEQPGQLQLLYYDREGKLQSASQRWQGTGAMQADETARLTAVPQMPQVQLQPGGDNMMVRGEVPVQVASAAGQGLSMVTGITLGEKQEPDPMRPSLILRRAGKDRLWDMARENSSTVERIRSANGLSGEPEPGRMLLIPVI